MTFKIIDWLQEPVSWQFIYKNYYFNRPSPNRVPLPERIPDREALFQDLPVLHILGVQDRAVREQGRGYDRRATALNSCG